MKLLLMLTLASVLFGCQLTPEPSTTIVEGLVLNKYTRQPVAGAPVAVGRYTYAFFGGGSYDSVTTAYTDASGHYNLSFEASDGGYYRVKVRHSTELYDLTLYPDGVSYTDGMATQRDTKNKFDFEVTPYKIVTIVANSSKEGKTDIAFSFVNIDTRDYYGGTIFYDTVKTNQKFIFTRNIKVLPYREYLFTKLLANRVKLAGYNYEFQDYVREDHRRQVLYNDTTRIIFH